MPPGGATLVLIVSLRYPESFRVELAEIGTPIDRFLRRRLSADPPHVRKLLRQKRVRFSATEPEEGKEPVSVMAAGETLDAVGTVEVLANDRVRRPPSPNKKKRPAVLFADQDLAVVVKLPGVAMHPGPRHGSDTLLNGLMARYPELAYLGADRNWGLVHRLDLETSGIVVVARTEYAYDGLVEQFKARTIEKQYLALVAVGADGLKPGVVKSPVAGKSAITEIESVERPGGDAPVAFVRCRPVTGRMHQIRVHLAERKAPVLFDPRYGTGKDELTARLYLKRLALHAAVLGFAHPRTSRPVRHERELPRDLRHSWRRAQKVFEKGASEPPESTESTESAEAPQDSPSPDQPSVS